MASKARAMASKARAKSTKRALRAVRIKRPAASDPDAALKREIAALMSTEALARFLVDEAEVEIIVDQDCIDYRGNVSAIDPVTDAEAESWVAEQLNRGNVWAWASVTVKASWRGFVAYASLGAVSCEDERAFRAAFFDDMRYEACRALAECILTAATPRPDRKAVAALHYAQEMIAEQLRRQLAREGAE